MRALSGRRRGGVVLTLTPLIDVVFILLVFFMLASQFAQWRVVELIPAVPGPQAAASPPPLVLRVDAQGGVRVGGAPPVPLEAAVAAVAAQLGSADGERAVVVEPLEGAAIQPVVSLSQALRAAGLPRVAVNAPQGHAP